LGRNNLPKERREVRATGEGKGTMENGGREETLSSLPYEGENGRRDALLEGGKVFHVSD